MKKRTRLSILRSDLDDLRNPKILEKYPHLDSDICREQIREAIKMEETKQ